MEKLGNEQYVKKQGAIAHVSISILMITDYLFILYQSSLASLEKNPFFGHPFDAIDRWGAKNSTLVLRDKQYWRLFTSLFLTHGLVDLIFSVGVLCSLGRSLEQRLGTKYWLLIYLVSGTTGFRSSFCLLFEMMMR